MIQGKSSARRIALFLAGFVLTYAVVMALALNNVTGIRGGPVNNNPFDLENENVADFIVLGIVAACVGLLTYFRIRIGVRLAFLVGQWAAIFAAGGHDSRPVMKTAGFPASRYADHCPPGLEKDGRSHGLRESPSTCHRHRHRAEQGS